MISEPTLAPRAAVGRACPISASAPADAPDAAHQLARSLGQGPFAQIFLFMSPAADMATVCAQMTQLFPQTGICGCSTAGEITAEGYSEGQIVAFALPRAGFDVEMVVLEDLDQLDTRELIADLLRARQSLGRRAFDRPNECAVLVVDGLSGKEDVLVSALSGGLGPVPLIGGSAGDGGKFQRTLIHARGRVLENAGVVTLIRSQCTVKPFSLDHLRPTHARMVVTEAAPAKRTVARINDEPAAEEYARLLGLRTDQLSPFIFAAHPVLVRAGGRHHVRAIQGVGPQNSLQFFAAIAEGLVLTIAEPQDIAEHLNEELGRFGREGAPSAILGFDCIFRRIEAEGRQRGREVSDILSRHKVVGFSTYGEQVGAMHVNQTLTGIAFYPPQGAVRD
ncbi:FIST C-terminal domain-containing protein [Sinirhodobacter sp. WL0062]|uniref:FIST C-terminal domain-containing protein n=1 Tax=Rhodobacter flavimaris TaxID=2907145 RepID=A0ABS8YQT9_9RHOB|nr:FIST N-terminal domain-containing protein [Sinirhodobacter sp. WL0062]MCE5972254.1 FIST C-terminal domain-containing protein [Sinirhodobacter sp. WL0062]